MTTPRLPTPEDFNEVKTCNHDKRCRFTDGFYCEECKTFFNKDSETYRRSELLFAIYLALYNVNVVRHRNGLEPFADTEAITKTIGINQYHEDYESLITEAETVMQRHGVNAESATIVLT